MRNVHLPTTTLGAILLCDLLLLCCCAYRAKPVTAFPGQSSWTYDRGGLVRGDPLRRQIALVFTGGEYGEGAESILDQLAELQIKASFFVTGDFIRNAAHAHALKRMVAEGHYLGPHSDSHPLYCDWKERGHTLITEAFFRDDLSKNLQDLRRLGALRTGVPVYFIPPYEWFNEEQVRWSRDLGVVLFNFTPGTGSNRDYIPEGQKGFVSSQHIMGDILAFERREANGLNGFVLLLHLGSQRQDKTHLLLESLLAELLRRGYEFIRIDVMFNPGTS